MPRMGDAYNLCPAETCGKVTQNDLSFRRSMRLVYDALQRTDVWRFIGEFRALHLDWALVQFDDSPFFA